VVIVVGLLIIGAILVFFAFPLLTRPFMNPPSIDLGPVAFTNGNATFEVASASASSPTGFFEVNLGVGTEFGTPRPIETTPAYATVSVAGQRFRVYFADIGGSSFLNGGDQFEITGDGEPLPGRTSFDFLLIWSIDGRVVDSTNWTTPTDKPVVTFASPTYSSGNVTVAVASTSQAVTPPNYRVNLQVGTNTGAAVAAPATGGAFVSVIISGTTYRVYWTDIGGELTVNAGDTFRIAGDGEALGSGSYTFYLLWSDGSQIQTVSFVIP
jgi:hypothetical protein